MRTAEQIWTVAPGCAGASKSSRESRPARVASPPVHNPKVRVKSMRIAVPKSVRQVEAVHHLESVYPPDQTTLRPVRVAALPSRQVWIGFVTDDSWCNERSTNTPS